MPSHVNVTKRKKTKADNWKAKLREWKEEKGGRKVGREEARESAS